MRPIRQLAAATLATALVAGVPAMADGDRVAATLLPTCSDGAPFLVYIVDASADDDCDATGGGTTEAPCLCLDGTYVAILASGGAAGDSFKTMNAPSGTDPVADSATDTLNLTTGATALSITGDSTTDTIAFDIAGTASKCARFDGSGELVAASGDCSAGDTTGGTSITLDLGDDGGNESSALTELATTGDDYGALTEPSADKALLAFAKVPPYRQYDPDRPPASCTACDEWTGDAAALTWRWGNQDSAASAVEYDGERLTGDATNELHVRWTTAPENADQTLTAKVGIVFDGSNATGDSCGAVVLHGGTEGSPSNLTYLMTGDFATDGIYLQSDSNYDPAAGATSHASIGWSLSTTQAKQLYYQLRYTDSTRALLAYYSWDGKTWTPLGTEVTLAADPVSWGFFTRFGAICRAEWFRLRTDAGRNNASD